LPFAHWSRIIARRLCSVGNSHIAVFWRPFFSFERSEASMRRPPPKQTVYVKLRFTLSECAQVGRKLDGSRLCGGLVDPHGIDRGASSGLAMRAH
jgi:hypothetical protein